MFIKTMIVCLLKTIFMIIKPMIVLSKAKNVLCNNFYINKTMILVLNKKVCLVENKVFIENKKSVLLGPILYNQNKFHVYTNNDRPFF